MDSIQPTPADSRLYTAAQVRELDRCAIEDHGIPGLELMERAGRAVFDATRLHFPDLSNWMIVCGGGNNGGDGYIVARLAREAGIECEVWALKTPEQLRGDAALAAKKWLESGGSVEIGTPIITPDHDLYIDSILGTGLDRPAEGDYATAINALNRGGAPVVSVDIASGLNSDTGCALGGLATKAALTVTFIGLKRGLFTADGPDRTGHLLFASLNVPEDIYRNKNSGYLIRENIIDSSIRKRLKNSHKGDYGWLLGIGGDVGMNGAVRLCGESALRSGAGKVTLLTHPVHAATLNIGCPELMVRGISDTADIGPFLENADVVALGTGLGQTSWSRDMFLNSIEFAGSMVLDADALNLVAADSGLEQLNSNNREMVITPHPAEAARLLGSDSQTIQSDRIGAAQELARRANCVTVLKGCGSVIAHPNGEYAICPLGNPGMASGGTGDVLTGVIGALLAQGLDAWAAAKVGVVAHAAAGDRAAIEIGERGLIASDLICKLPQVLNPDS